MLDILCDRMILVNGKRMEWHMGLTFPEIYSFLGYTISSPPVLVKVNGHTVKRKEREGFTIPDGAEITVTGTLRGG